jgi:hypothetical protein
VLAPSNFKDAWYVIRRGGSHPDHLLRDLYAEAAALRFGEFPDPRCNALDNGSQLITLNPEARTNPTFRRSVKGKTKQTSGGCRTPLSDQSSEPIDWSGSTSYINFRA